MTQRRSHWFLPETPDLLGMLVHQGEVTVAGLDACQSWAEGDDSQAHRVRALEHEADRARRALMPALQRAFVTPLSPEDLYELSERLDAVLNGAKNLVRETEVLHLAPDQPMAQMVGLVGQGVRDLVAAFGLVASDPKGATDRADEAVRCQREIERVYRAAMGAILENGQVAQAIGRRELYRRCARLGDAVDHVAHRIWYAVVKEQ